MLRDCQDGNVTWHSKYETTVLDAIEKIKVATKELERIREKERQNELKRQERKKNNSSSFVEKFKSTVYTTLGFPAATGSSKGSSKQHDKGFHNGQCSPAPGENYDATAGWTFDTHDGTGDYSNMRYRGKLDQAWEDGNNDNNSWGCSNPTDYDQFTFLNNDYNEQPERNWASSGY